MALRIHITSSGPRTGTTLLSEAMRTCFQIDCSSEHEAPIAKSDTSFGNCKIILTKEPTLSYGLDRLLDLNKNLKIIVVYRDPRDMICSFHGRAEGIYYCNLDYWFYFVEQYKKLSNKKNILFLKYEEFVTNPNEVQKQINDFIPQLVKKHDFSHYHLHTKPNEDSLYALKSVRPISSSSIGLWKSHLPRMKQQHLAYPNLSESLIVFNYEKDKFWLELLEKVEAVTYETFKENHIPERKGAFYLAYTNMLLEKTRLNPDLILMPIKGIKKLLK